MPVGELGSPTGRFPHLTSLRVFITCRRPSWPPQIRLFLMIHHPTSIPSLRTKSPSSSSSSREDPRLYNWIVERQPAALCVYIATALHHSHDALREWQRNEGAPPARAEAEQSAWMQRTLSTRRTMAVSRQSPLREPC